MKVQVERTKEHIVRLRVHDGVLFVTANSKLTLSQIQDIIESKRDWILQQTAEKSNCTTHNRDSGHRNETLADMFAGKQCLLCGQIHLVKPSQESKCFLENNCIYMPEKFFKERDSRVKTLKTYLKKLSVQFVSEEISKFGSNASLCPTKIEFRTISNGWLKCTDPKEKSVVLDFRICQLPAELQHYLIAHAFAHFTDSGHGDGFFNTLSNFLPHYKNCAEQLKKYDFLKEI